MKRTRVGVGLGLACWLAVAAAAGGAPAAGAPGAYLKNGADARVMALGGAGAALGGEASAVFWNPAALASVPRPGLAAGATVFPGTGEYSQLAFALPLGLFAFPADARAGGQASASAGTVALSILRFAAGYDIEARRDDSLNPNYRFSDVEGAYGMAFGLPLGAGWSAGFGAKGLTHLLDQTRATGWGLDGGVFWTDGGAWSAGLAVRDLYTALTWATGRVEAFPATARLGAAYRWRPGASQHLLLTAEAEQSATTRPTRWRGGVEYGFAGVLFARGGYADGLPAVGAGVCWPETGWGRLGLRLDYAWVQDPIEGADHWLTLKLDF